MEQAAAQREQKANMSNATYNGQWAGAMAELAEQVHLEDPTLEAEEGAPEPEPVRPTSIAQAFQHFACLYIKYLQIFRKLERCYDGMVHPQKRLAVLKVLELVMQSVVLEGFFSYCLKGCCGEMGVALK